MDITQNAGVDLSFGKREKHDRVARLGAVPDTNRSDHTLFPRPRLLQRGLDVILMEEVFGKLAPPLRRLGLKESLLIARSRAGIRPHLCRTDSQDKSEQVIRTLAQYRISLCRRELRIPRYFPESPEVVALVRSQRSE